MKKYNLETADDVREFFRSIIAEHNATLMPDDDFSDYVKADGTPSFTPEEAQEMNDTMTRAFDICDAQDLDIYEIASEIQVEEYKKKGLLPENFDNSGRKPQP